jgi:hypothetical protein
MDPIRVTRPRHRAAILRAVIGIMRLDGEAYQGTSRLGPAVENSLIIQAIVLGQADGRPMTASDIAGYLGVPRSTVIHRIDRMPKRIGVMRHKRGRRVEYSIAIANDPKVIAALVEECKAITVACRELSKPDT